MAKRNRRRGGRVNAGPQGPLTQLLRQNHQAHGALGVINFVAHLAVPQDEKDTAPSAQRGRAIIRMLDEDRSKVAAAALAVTAAIWPDEEVRAAAGTALEARRGQLSGVMRDLDQTCISEVWRLTDEYRDSSALLIELKIGGRKATTLAALSYRFHRSSVEFSVLSVGAGDAAQHFDVKPSPGGPRRILEQLSIEDARFETWMLTACRNIDGDPGAATMFRWVARLLDVDVQFPEIPRFNRQAEDEDEHPDVSNELTTFLAGTPGRAWSGEPFMELVDYLESNEQGAGAMRWSPARVEHFLFSPDLFDLWDNVLAMPALLRGWVTHCASVMGQRKPLLRAVLEEIDRCEPEFLSDAAA